MRSTSPLSGLTVISWLTAALFLLPVAVGLIGTWLPAFGWFPAIGADRFSFAPWVQFWQYPGVHKAFWLTLLSGISATFIALALTFLLLLGAYPSPLFNKIEKLISPLLSVPHAAFAIGLGFLFVPSGWLIRTLHAFTGEFSQTPQWQMFQDPQGLSLVLALALKETPFLVFMSLAILPQLKASKTLWLARSLGHKDTFTWQWLLFPQLYKGLKLPLFAVLAYSLSVVDIALIAGPTVPPTLAVIITNLFNDPDISLRLAGAAGATALLILIALLLGLLHLLEIPLASLRRLALSGSGRYRPQRPWFRYLARALSLIIVALYSASLLVTFLWSITGRWRFPDLLPQSFSLRAWHRVSERIAEPLFTTLSIALLSAVIATVLVIIALENEVRLKYHRRSVNSQRILLIVYLPLLIPQIAFLFGFQVSLIYLQLDGTFAALLWSHLTFVLPYVFLTLSGPYHRFDERYSWLALSLTGSRLKSYWQIKFPLLMRPILYAFATGFSVSIAQYLPTLFIGSGRFNTVTTEAVAMISGSDRRMMAVMALWQQLLPLIIFALATGIPALWFRKRRAMNHSMS